MEIRKSAGHQKIIHDFGKLLVCNWLSRSGFEVELVNRTGLDIIAYDSKTEERIGISLKSRTRNVGKEKTVVRLFTHKKEKSERQKFQKACAYFNCKPWIAIYVETLKFADAYLVALEHFDAKYKRRNGKPSNSWNMSPYARELYDKDPKIKHITFDFQALNWR